MRNKIIVKDIVKKFGTKKVIDKISFNVINGEFLSIIGPSGCGKTTLLSLLNNFIDNYKGKIKLFGKSSFIFQNHNLLPWKTIRENIEIGPINNNLKFNAKKLLKDIELGMFINYYPSQLSEGMKQRVGIARALANNPDILLMDEPFSSLDYLTRLKMHELILRIKKERNLTIVLVTHDIDEAIKLSDRIIVLSKSPSKILKTINNKSLKDKNKIRDNIIKLLNV